MIGRNKMTAVKEQLSVEFALCPELQETARDAIKDGLEVYVSPLSQHWPGRKSGFYVTDGTRIGSIEYSGPAGIKFATVHMATGNGTGAIISDGWVHHDGIIAKVRETLAHVPDWWCHGRVKKYTDFKHFNRVVHKENLIQVSF
jgi:hypothetical protein